MDFDAYLRGGLDGYLGATLAPTKAPTIGPVRTSAVYVQTKTASAPKTTAISTPPSTTSSTTPRRMTTAPTTSGAGTTTGPSLPADAPPPDAFVPTYEKPSGQTRDAVQNGSTRGSGARRHGLPWILIFVGIAFAYAVTQEK